MAIVHPFRALRPRPDSVSEVACVPYDVISVDEARGLAAGKPDSFLHVIRPEIDLPEGVDEHDAAVYTRGADNLKRFRSNGVMVHENVEAVYAYRQSSGSHSQTGVFACVAVSDYDADVIVKHELTRPVKEDDRTKHILTQSAHAEPVMLTYRDSDRVTSLVNEVVAGDPLYDFVAADGVRHTVWRIDTSDEVVRAFATVPRLYVADGHHRCKAASRAAAELRGTDSTGSEEYEFFPAVLFPMSHMRILAYNRILHDLGMSPDDFKARLTENFKTHRDAPPEPPKGSISVYLGDGWLGVELPVAAGQSVAARLDVARLADHILRPLLGIADQRTDSRIGFVGGIRGTKYLEELVNQGKCAAAISLHATGAAELLAVSDAGELMPPKSTWFEPKLRSGLLVHLF